MSSIEERQLNHTLLALADPTRRAILAKLASGAARITDLAAPFDMSLNAVSKHIKVLERAGLVRRQVSGREHRVEIDPAPLRAVESWIVAQRRFWDTSLDKLERLLLAKRGSRRHRRDD